MSILAFSRTILPIGTAAATLLAGGITYEGYRRSTEPSKFELATKQLMFKSAKEQEALLGIFHRAGYLEPQKLWYDIYCFNKGSGPKSGKMFSAIMTALQKAKLNQTDKNLDLKLLRKNLFKSTDSVKTEDIEAWILYVAQNAFNRQVGQERNELTSSNWMELYKEEYMKYAKTLGMVDAIVPTQQEYPQAWIAGASRVGLLARILNHNTLMEEIKINGGVLVLAGERPLWANLDGINPETYKKLLTAWQNKQDINQLDISVLVGEDAARVEEGKEYLARLAQLSNIKLNPEQPFIVYKEGGAPKGLFPGRVYPNYAEDENKSLTESLMSSDLLKTFLMGKVVVIDTKAGENNQRPDTASTAYDAAEHLVTSILKGDFGVQKKFTILFESNNPYIKRQAIATQREVDKVVKKHGLDKQGYSIKVEGVGFGAKQDVATIHSEFGALVAELFKDNSNNSHDINNLLFQTRKCPEPIPEIPNHYENQNYLAWIIGEVQSFFDGMIQ